MHSRCGRRRAPLPIQAPSRAPLHRRARWCRRRWWRDCRRWCSFPPPRATAETAGRLRKRAAARSAARRRPRRSWCSRRCRCRGSCPAAASRRPPRRCAESDRRRARYCPLAAPARHGVHSQACKSQKLPPSIPAAGQAAIAHETGRALRSDMARSRLDRSQHICRRRSCGIARPVRARAAGLPPARY